MCAVAVPYCTVSGRAMLLLLCTMGLIAPLLFKHRCRVCLCRCLCNTCVRADACGGCQVRECLLDGDMAKAERVLLGLVHRFVAAPPRITRSHSSAAPASTLARWRRNVIRHLVVGDALGMYTRSKGASQLRLPCSCCCC